MRFEDKNGVPLEIGQHVAWMKQRYQKEPVRRVGKVTKLKAARAKNGKDIYRVVLHLNFSYPYSYQSSRYIDLPEGTEECKAQYVLGYVKTFRGEERPYHAYCNKAQEHEGPCGRRDTESYTAHSRHYENSYPSFPSYDGHFGTIEVVDEPTTTAETCGEPIET